MILMRGGRLAAMVAALLGAVAAALLAPGPGDRAWANANGSSHSGAGVSEATEIQSGAAAKPAGAGHGAPPLATYGRLPGFETAAISPSGAHVAMLATAGEERLVIVIDAAGQLVTKIPVGDVKVRSLDWAGDEALLVDFTKTINLGVDFSASKTELASTVVVPLGGDKPWTIFAQEAGITGGVQGRYGVVWRRGHWFAYVGGITLGHDVKTNNYWLKSGRLVPDLYEVDLGNRHTVRVAAHPDNDMIDRDWLLDGNGKLAVIMDYNRTTSTWRLGVPGKPPLASGTSPSRDINLIGFAPDGAGVIYSVRDMKAQRDDWFIVPLAGGAPQAYLAEETFQYTFKDASHRLLGYVDDLTKNEAHFFDPLREKIYQASRKAFPEQQMVLKDFSEDFKRLIVTTEGGGDPIAWWMVDISSGSATPLGMSYPMTADQVAPFRLVAYKAADGLAMDGVLTLPPGRPEKGLPAVVLPHGGPTAHDRPMFDWIAQAFASRGYAVFQPNFRGSTGHGADFELAGHGEWGRKMQSDISDGLADLARQGIVDPQRVCIVGASYGGYAALAGVTLQQGLYRCAVAIAGISDVARMVATDVSESGFDPLLKRALGEEVGTGRDLDAISPLRFVNRVAVPVMLIHGKDDTVVSPDQSKAMANALRKAGKSVEYVTLPGEDHWLSRGATRQAMLEAAVGFVTRNNPP
jgi:dipeptidyl aminopeptidase/acylaminoacyl peptidase